MFVRTRKRQNGKTQIQILESQRVDNKIKQKVIRSLGVASTEDEVRKMVRIGEDIIVDMKNAKMPVLAFEDPYDVHRPQNRSQTVSDDVRLNNLTHDSNVNDGNIDVFGKTFDEIGLRKLFGTGKKSSDWYEILKAHVLGRIACPQSKRGTARYLYEEMALKISVDRVYRMMDHLVGLEDPIKKAICGKSLFLFDAEVNVLFFDVTTLYFESNKSDGLRDFGFSKDCKFKDVQVLLAMVTTSEGLPITYKLYPGNTFEGSTLIDAVKDLKQEYKISEVLLVADRGMYNKKNLSLMEEEGIKYIVAAKLKSMPSRTKNMILEDLDFEGCIIENDLHWIKEYEHEERRLVVGYNSKRARKDQSDRKRLVERLLKKVKDGKIKISELIPNYGTKKFLKVEGGKGVVNIKKIAEEEKWDGLHGVITNIEGMAAHDILKRYRGLWRIEEAFRINKHTLKMRPIYHWNQDRIQAHILICYLAFATASYTVAKLKKKGVDLSIETIRRCLNSVESIVLQDKVTKCKYVMPSKLTSDQKKIYNALKIKRIQTPFPINP